MSTIKQLFSIKMVAALIHLINALIMQHLHLLVIEVESILKTQLINKLERNEHDAGHYFRYRVKDLGFILRHDLRLLAKAAKVRRKEV